MSVVVNDIHSELNETEVAEVPGVRDVAAMLRVSDRRAA